MTLLLVAVCTLVASGSETRAQATVPAAPTGLTAPTVAHDSVTLSWDDPGDGSITGYQVLRRSRDGDEYGDGRGAAEFAAVVDDTGSSATTYTDTSVTPRTLYVYRMKARNVHGLGERSSYANVETPAAPAATPVPVSTSVPTPTVAPSVPAAPTSLAASSAAHNGVTLTEAERPSYAGLRVDVLERADGELMIRYQGEAVDFQEGPPPSSALWGTDSGCSPDPGLQEATDGVAHSHLNVAQRERLSTLESAGKEASEGRGAKGKPIRHQLHRTPTSTQQARWEAVQLAKEQGLSLRAISRNLGMARDTVGKYLKAESPPTKKLSAKEIAKAEALTASSTAAD